MRRLLPLLLLLAAPVPAHAGDPCPIGLELHEYTPEWRSRADDLAALRTKRAWIGVNYRGDDTVTIQRTIPGSPAHAAGLLRGDVIAAFDGVPVGGQKHLNELFDAAHRAVVLTIETDGVSRLVGLERGPADPVFLGLVNAAETQECRAVHVQELTVPQQAALVTGAFDTNRGFRCDDAHAALMPAFDSGDVVMIRGGRRILLTMPGWGTTCVSVGDYDGEGLTTERLRSLIESLARPYVADRHANP